MFEWFKKLSRETSAKNIAARLDDLIEAANLAFKDMTERGAATPYQLNCVNEAQRKLLFELAGPLPIDEVIASIVNPRIQKGGISYGAHIAIEHVFTTVDQAVSNG